MGAHRSACCAQPCFSIVGQRRGTACGAACGTPLKTLATSAFLDALLYRGKLDQVSFLHVFHHVGVFWTCFLIARHGPGGDPWLPTAYNAGVHILMYRCARGLIVWQQGWADWSRRIEDSGRCICLHRCIGPNWCLAKSFLGLAPSQIPTATP